MKRIILKNIILFIVFIWWGCTDKITISEGSEFQFASTYFSYDTSSNELYLYADIENVSLTNAIDYVRADLYNSGGLAISSVELVPISNGIVSQNPYSKTYVIPELEYDVYTVTFTMKDESGNLLSEDSDRKDLSPITLLQPSQIIDYSMAEVLNGSNIEIINNSVTLDDHDWKAIYFALHISDSNSVADIVHVKYEIKGTLDGCTDDNNNDGEIDSGNEWENYWSEDNWEFEFSDYQLSTCHNICHYSINDNYDTSFIWLGVMRLRPRDGSALNDVNGQPEPGYEAADCGKIGTVFLKFIVTDGSDDPTIIEDIPLDILAP